MAALRTLEAAEMWLQEVERLEARGVRGTWDKEALRAAQDMLRRALADHAQALKLGEAE